MKSLLNRLDKETFVLDLLEPLTDSSLLQGIEYHQVDPTTIEVELQRQEGLNDLFTVLTERGIKVGSMKNKVNRLEELFLTVVERPESVE